MLHLDLQRILSAALIISCIRSRWVHILEWWVLKRVVDNILQFHLRPSWEIELGGWRYETNCIEFLDDLPRTTSVVLQFRSGKLVMVHFDSYRLFVLTNKSSNVAELFCTEKWIDNWCPLVLSSQVIYISQRTDFSAKQPNLTSVSRNLETLQSLLDFLDVPRQHSLFRTACNSPLDNNCHMAGKWFRSCKGSPPTT